VPEAPGRCLLVSPNEAAGWREQLCQPSSRDHELVIELSPGRWWLLETSSQAAKSAVLLPSSLPGASTDMLLGFVTKRLHCS
jgi:hypothetical protein